MSAWKELTHEEAEYTSKGDKIERKHVQPSGKVKFNFINDLVVEKFEDGSVYVRIEFTDPDKSPVGVALTEYEAQELANMLNN